MPTINVIFSDLESLVGRILPKDNETLTELLAFVKGEVESLDGEELSIEVKDGNRPDLWSVEGIARALRGVIGIEEGRKQYSIGDSVGVDIKVDLRLQKIRPYIASAIVLNTCLSDIIIQELMHLQDKLDQTYGRMRSRASIGLYNFRLIHPPINYTVTSPTGVSFIPLGGDRKMSLKEIINTHPKGLEYGHIIKDFKEWPILFDAKGEILSFPPIINSSCLGKVTEDTKDVLIEVTGTDHLTVLNTLILVTLSIADRGGDISTVRIIYPYSGIKEEVTPNFPTSEVELQLKLINEVLGLDLSQEEVLKFLKKARYDAFPAGSKSIIAKVPCYRFDIMHPVDVVEDVAIMYGYNNIKPRWPQLVTSGELNGSELIFDEVREVMTGLGFQEILSFSMTTPQKLFKKMNVKPQRIVEVANPINERFTCIRSWLIPSIMEFLSNNTHVSYPQRIFEVGECATLDRSNKTGVTETEKLACLLAHSTASFSEIKAILDAFLLNVGLKYALEEASHGTFTEGRVGKILVEGKIVGVIGEIHPKVIETWGIENPIAGFEIDLTNMFGLFKGA